MDDINCISQIESTIDKLAEHTSCRVYITYSHDSTPVEFMTHKDFRMLPFHIKQMSWLLAIRNLVKIVFESTEMGSTEVVLSTLQTDKKKRQIRWSRIGIK
jgi:hypothetical protein